MFCTKCGTALNGNKFCIVCGKPVDDSATNDVINIEKKEFTVGKSVTKQATNGEHTLNQIKDKVHKPSFWISVLYVCVWISIVVGLGIAVALAIVVCEEIDVFTGIVVGVGGAVMTIISSALIMVALNAANDIRTTRMYMKEIKDRINK